MKKIFLSIAIILAILGVVFAYVYDRTVYIQMWQAEHYFEKALKLDFKNRKIKNIPEKYQEYEENFIKMYAFFEKADIILLKSIKKHPNHFNPRAMQITFDMYQNADLATEDIKNLLLQSHINKNNWIGAKNINTQEDLLKYIQDIQAELFTHKQDIAIEKIALEVLKYYPNHFESLNTLGTIYIFMNEFEKAEKYFNQALALAPNDDIVKSNLKQLAFLKQNGFVFKFERRGDLAFYGKKGGGIYAVKGDKVLFKVYNFDNGPDYLEHGLFRIIDENDLVGFADEKGNVVIKPQYKFANIQEDGTIKATHTGYLKPIDKHGEYNEFISNDWFIIKNPKIKGEK